MGYFSTDSRYQHAADLNLLASAARTSSVNGPAVDPEGSTVGYFTVSVTASSGTSPTLNVKIQGERADGVWFDIVSFTQAVGVSSETRAVPLPGRRIRAVATIGGTSPSFTFSVSGESKS